MAWVLAQKDFIVPIPETTKLERLKENIKASQYLSTFHDWKQVLSSIIELPYKEKKLIIIDEFPYMCKYNKSIPSILQNLWDTTLKNENVMIILCGSAMSFIEK